MKYACWILRALLQVLLDPTVLKAVGYLGAVVAGIYIYEAKGEDWDYAVIIVASVGVIGLACPVTARLLLPDRPRAAYVLLELSQLVIFVIAVALSALTLHLGDWLGPSDTEAGKSQLSAATAIITALILSLSGDDGSSWTAKLSKDAFKSAYDDDYREKYKDKPGYLQATKIVEATHSNFFADWGRAARRDRAGLIASLLEQMKAADKKALPGKIETTDPKV